MINYKEMPKGTLNINLIQVFSTVGYAILMGLLNFYLTNHGGFSKTEANTLTASFFALNFLLHFLGGALGGKYFSFRGLFLFSLVLQIISMFFIATTDKHLILMGMALFITGSGLNVSCVNMMLTQLFAANDKKRNIAFSVNYSCMNIGFVMSFIFAGIMQGNDNYHIAFYAASVCLVIAFIIHLLNLKNVNDKSTYFEQSFSKSNARFVVAPAIITVCFFFSLFLMYNPHIGTNLVIVTFVAVLSYLLYIAYNQSPEYRLKIFAFIILSSACMIFAFVQGMQSSALETFVEFNTNKSLFGISLQPATVNAFESLGVIVFGFVLAICSRRRHLNNKTLLPGSLITRGVGLYIIAFMMIPLGIHFAGSDGIVNVIFPILLLIIVAAGEIHVNATNYALVGELIEPKHQGLFTGYMFVSIAIGIVMSGPISNYAIGNIDSNDISAIDTNHLYSNIFSIMTVIAVFITIVFFLISKRLNKVFISEK